MAGKPNILILMVDQFNGTLFPDGPADWLHTPNLAKLAERSTRFANTYTASPLCAPGRASFMSGQLPSRTRVYDNAAEFPADIPTYAHHLRRAGYHTCLSGKMHFVGPDQLHGYEERLTTDIYPADFGWTPDWGDAEGRFDWWFHNLDSVTGAGVAEATNQLDFDDDVGFRAVRKLHDLARTDDDRPWFTTVSFTHPHDPYVARRRFWDRYDHDSIPLPSVASVAEPDPHSVRLSHVMAADVTSPTEEQVRTARHAYLANVSYLDDFVAELLETLDALSMTDDTVIIFTADHGDMLGERRLWYKMNYFEPSARIPLIMAGPGIDGGGGVSPVAASLLDIAPTLLDVAGAKGTNSLDDFDGDSLLEVAAASPADRTVVGEYLGEGAVAPIFMIRRGSEKFVWSPVDPPQLYDLATDPLELTNRADLPASQAAVDGYVAEVHRRWNVEAIDQAVRVDQARRRLVDNALRQGRHTPWDHQPHTEASEQYMRNHLDLNDVEARRRI